MEPEFDREKLSETWGMYFSVENYGDGGLVFCVWGEKIPKVPQWLARLTKEDTEKLLRYIASGNSTVSPCYGLFSWADNEHWLESGETPRASQFPDADSAIGSLDI